MRSFTLLAFFVACAYALPAGFPDLGGLTGSLPIPGADALKDPTALLKGGATDALTGAIPGADAIKDKIPGMDALAKTGGGLTSALPIGSLTSSLPIGGLMGSIPGLGK